MDSPYAVKRNDKVGRYVVTSRALKAGEEVLVEEPWVVGPKSGSGPMCLGCYWPLDGSTLCSVCGWPVCGPECEARPNHRDFECQVFASVKQRYQAESPEDVQNGSPQYECITPLRMLLMKEKHPERWVEEVQHMEAHVDRRKNLPDWTSEHVNVVEFLRRKCSLANRFSEELIHWALSVLQVNAFEVRTVYGYFVRGLYPKTALMSHSCVANTTHTIYANEDFRSRIRVTVDVPEGGELYVSYTYSIQPTIMRRSNVWHSKYFWCDCKRCADPTELGTHLSTLKCTKCDNGAILSTDSLNQDAIWKCTHCEFTVKPEIVLKICKMIQDEIDNLEAIEEFDVKIQEAERLLKKYKSVLHPHNVYMTSLRHSLVQWYGRAPGFTFEDLPDIMLERKIEMCRQVLQVVDVVKPGMNRFRGIVIAHADTDIHSQDRVLHIALRTSLHITETRNKAIPLKRRNTLGRKETFCWDQIQKILTGMVLYELHVPMMLYNRHLYEYKELTKEQFKEKMEEVARVLEEAVNILLLEDPVSPEGAIGQAGVQSLQQLKESIIKI